MKKNCMVAVIASGCWLYYWNRFLLSFWTCDSFNRSVSITCIYYCSDWNLYCRGSTWENGCKRPAKRLLSLLFKKGFWEMGRFWLWLGLLVLRNIDYRKSVDRIIDFYEVLVSYCSALDICFNLRRIRNHCGFIRI